MNNEYKECSITWFIENYSHCSHKYGEKLVSPEIIANDLEGTVWTLQLYPRGQKYECKENISLFLNRRKDDNGQEEIPLEYELSLLAVDGSTLHSKKFDCTFGKRNEWGQGAFVSTNEVLLRREHDYLPQDTLTVRCRMWKGKENPQPATQIHARTKIGIEKFSFLHAIDDFSELEPDKKKSIQVKSPKNKIGLSSSLYFSEDSYSEEKIMLHISPPCSNQILSQCKLSLLDESSKVIECGVAVFRFGSAETDLRKLPLPLTRQTILRRKSLFLPDGKLTVMCECTFTSGVEYHKVESTRHEKPVPSFDQMSENNQCNEFGNSTESLSGCPSALDDLKEIYDNQILIDVELKTKTKSFPAHKTVICARSPVFRAMMTNDMREKNNNLIQVDDLEDDIVQQLLLFLYSDELENLQWDSAVKLYYAGDKYQVEKLKMVCSSFLLDNINISRTSELLLLADSHNDSHLNKAVVNFILEHEKEVFGSREWEKLMEINPLLVSKTMLLKYK